MSIFFIVLAILFTIFATIRPFKVKGLPINIATGALLSILILFIFGVVTPNSIVSGILGNEYLEPWKIILIFFSAAYISISTDITGIFDYLAYRIVQKSKGNKLELFIFFFLFAGILTIFTSNDIVILTLTPIIFYVGKHAKLNIIPFLFAEFFAANTFSMFFYVNNPTDIIVALALDLDFLEYAKIMFLPTIVASFGSLVILFAIFRKHIIGKFELEGGSYFSVRSWTDAYLSILVLVIMFTIFSISEFLSLEIWSIALAFAIIFIIKDVTFELYFYTKEKATTKAVLDKRKDTYNLPEKNKFISVIKYMPWYIFLFIFTFFILVNTLDQLGAIDSIARFIVEHSQNLLSSIFTMGGIGVALANIINNQPMTVLLTNVLVNDSFNITASNLQGSAYALVVASNLGANITIIGALAGLMWEKILRTKGIKISYIDFLKIGLIVTPIVFCITLLTLYLVLK